MSLKEILQRATKEHWAIGHFNISNAEQLRGIVQAAKECLTPVMIGTSQGERDALGLYQSVYLVRAFCEEYGIPIFLNADHSKNFDTAKAAVDAGYDSIHIDASELSYEENVEVTGRVVEYVKAKNPEISVEGELGYLRGSSSLQQVTIAVRQEDLTDPAKAGEFVKRTGVNRLAVVVGNSHGISLDEPCLDIERIAAIRRQIPAQVALVLHGGSGIPDRQIEQSIDAGIANIHINTEIRLVFTDALRNFLAAHPEETTPYKYYPDAIDAVRQKVKEKLQIFQSCGRIT